MSEVRLVIREANCDWSGTIHGSCAETTIAALSADPVTIDELEAATERFAKPTESHDYFVNLRRGFDTEPYDAGLVVIDLVARLVVVDSTYCSPAREGSVNYHDGRSATDHVLRYHAASDWVFQSDGEGWEYLAKERRRDLAAMTRPDARQVFYGRPMLEFIVREVFAAFTRRDEPQPEPAHSEKYVHDALKQIHANWLLTPRDDLLGACPREVALERHDHIDRDLQDRCEQWSCLGKCPRGLAETSHAFQHGGFGTHELVEYYELVRDLLWSCWDQLTEMEQSPEVGHRSLLLTVGDFLTTEVPRLGSVREAWLDMPDPEFHGRTPRSIISRERARLPEAVSGKDAVIDPDCPCCQMMAELPGPTFWHLDGCNMDDEFAFNIHCKTREDWEKEQSDWEDFNRRFEAESAERQRL